MFYQNNLVAEPQQFMEIWHNSVTATVELHIDGLVQDCSNSSALAMQLLQFCT